MHILQPLTDLLYNGSGLLFRELTFLLDLLKTTVWKGFEHEIEILLIMEVPIQSRQITIVQVRLDLDLSQNVLFNFSITDTFL